MTATKNTTNKMAVCVGAAVALWLTISPMGAASAQEHIVAGQAADVAGGVKQEQPSASSKITGFFTGFGRREEEKAPSVVVPQKVTPSAAESETVHQDAVIAPALEDEVMLDKSVKESPNKEEQSSRSKSEKSTKSKSEKANKTTKSDKDAKVAATDVIADMEPLSFEQLARKWETDLDKIEDAINASGRKPTAEVGNQRDDVRRIRSQAQEESRIAQEVLDSKAAMLATLGEAPAADVAGPVIPEDKKIISLRKQINDDIARADARVKRSALVLNRAQAMLDDFTAMEQAEIRMMLLSRSEPLYSGVLWQGASDESQLYQSDSAERKLAKWYVVAVLFFSVLLTFFYTPTVRWLNAWNQEVQLQTRRAPFFIAFFGCLLVLGIRYDIYMMSMYVYLHTLIHTALVLIIGVAFWRMLSAVRFEEPNESVAEDEDARGYRQGGYWQKLWTVSRIANMAALLLCCVGYVNLASYVSVNLFLSLMTVAGFVIARRMIAVMLRRINAADKEILSPRHIIIMEPVLLIPFAMLALYFWGVTPEVVQNWLDQYSGGVPIGSIVIDPRNFISAMVVLFSLIMLTRLVQWFLGERVMTYARVEKGVHNTVHSITGYVGYIIAVLTAMGTLGIDMANLAIVAGALSVGIGFGLQAIFNNFVSGLILLLERPVRVGDWIVVGALEGTVSKIRVRSTEITTFQNASVIIPNSMLITDTVTNWTLNDAMGRVDIQVGVAYDSDVQLVRKLLLKAAQEHPEVRKRPEIKVFFMDFGESALTFELRCFIRNIDARLGVMSDLRFKINDAFAKNNIVIPYPQRVIHTVSTTQSVETSEVGDVGA